MAFFVMLKTWNILQFNTILTNLFLVTAVAQFTAKMTNSERAIYFLSLKSCSVNKLKSDMLFTCRNVMFSYFTWKKRFCSRKWWGGRGRGGRMPHCSPPFSTALIDWVYLKEIGTSKYSLKSKNIADVNGNSKCCCQRFLM